MLLFLSPDSWLAHLCGPRIDSSWFYTAGRAWMEGQTPYVDFADSKGPVLWLIYGIGYLMSPTNYIGIFFQSVIYFAVSYYFIWLTARLYTHRRAALFVLFLMPLLLFFRNRHIETRAEDFTLPWIFMSIYITCRCLMQPTRSFIRKGAFWLGFGMMFCLLVKWNVFFMMGGTALIVAAVSLKQKSTDAIVYGLGGMTVLAAPFVIYFACTGTLSAFIQEYFVNTYLITDTEKTLGKMIYTFVVTFCVNKTETMKTIAIVLPFVGMWLFCRRHRVSYWLIFSYVPFYLFLAFKAPFFHYCCMAVPYYIFLLIVLTDVLQRWICRLTPFALGTALTVIYVGTIAISIRNTNSIFKSNDYEPVWNAMQEIMCRKDKPTFMFSGIDMGEGLLSRALPGCRYWARQFGSTPAMDQERKEAIQGHRLDFIVITDDSQEGIIPFIEKCGYRQCKAPVTVDGQTVTKALPLYERPTDPQ